MKKQNSEFPASGIEELRATLRQMADLKKAAGYLRFFKTGPGDYGHGDKFYGISVPDQRKVLKNFLNLSYKEIEALLAAAFHEERFIALQILVHRFEHSDAEERSQVYSFYMDHLNSVNNWDLVDLSAPQIVGGYLFDKPGESGKYAGNSRLLLYEFARSENLWKRRIAIMATFYFIRKGDFKTTLDLSEILLHDKQDLIHKAVGWMLREIGNRDRQTEEKFIKQYASEMPRTMLRYAIEKFPEDLRKEYLGSRKRS